jgi:cytochrome c-type biogenesis protein CcmF
VTRRWTLLAWGCLTAGIVLGAWWSYQVLGWGGFWAWDPVENASFVPWLTATAFLHSAAVQERRGMLRVWNLSLLSATFSLTILGTFLTRSGVLESVHSFTESSIGPIILGFFGLVVAVAVALIGWRADRLRGPGSLDSPLSREGAFLFNNVLFALFAFVVLLGTVFPLLVQAVNGSTIAVGAPYFDRMGAPIALCLLFLMAAGVALPWRRASMVTARSRLLVPAWAGVLTVFLCAAAGLRGWEPLVSFGLAAFAGTAAARRLLSLVRREGPRALLGRTGGGMVVHIGVVVVAVGLAASLSYGKRTEARLGVGQSTRFDGHTVTYLGDRQVRYPNHTSLDALVQLDGGRVGEPAISQFAGVTEGIGTPWVVSGLHDDVYLTLDVGPSTPGGPAVIGVVVQPLVRWLWVGGIVMVVGTALAAVPERRQRRTRRRRDRAPGGAVELASPGGAGGGAGVRDEAEEPAGIPVPVR